MGHQPQEPEPPTGDDDRGKDDYHDPTAGLGGAPPARSALTLRLVLASVGLVACVVLAVLLQAAGAQAVVVALPSFFAVVAVVDLVIIIRRKARGEPG